MHYYNVIRYAVTIILDKSSELIWLAKKREENIIMNKMKIIVVEDNILYCESIYNLLAREIFCTVKVFHLLTAKKTSTISCWQWYRGF